MNYKLINPELSNQRDILSIEEIVLKNRGIKSPETYLNLDDTFIYNYKLLDNIEFAVHQLTSHIKSGDDIHILVDPDVDGQCSSAILYQYLKRMNLRNEIYYILQSGKQHGIPENINIDGIKLLIIPDAGTNDVDECKRLNELGIEIIVLDHHEVEKDNPFAIIVNPHIGNYPNKQLSGTAVTYKFLQCLDEYLWGKEAEDYLDLVALSLISDSMSLLEYENKRLIEKGLGNIKNKLFLSLIEKQSYSLNGKTNVNINDIQYYIAPLINAIIRSGNQDEKHLLFNAFIESDQTFDYKKRGEKETVQEDIYSRVARLAVNAKAKQAKEVDRALEVMHEKIEKYHWDKNKILFCECSEIDYNITGLVAIKLANEYNKPCVMLRESYNKKPKELSGSIRNYDGSPIDNLKQYLSRLPTINYIRGHANAAGISLPKDEIRNIIALTNEQLKDTNFEKVYRVDFVFLPNEITINFAKEIERLKDHYGMGISESLILVKDIHIDPIDIQIMGKDNDTWKFPLNDDIMAIKFKCNEKDEILNIKKENELIDNIFLDIVGKVSINYFNGIYNYQVIVVDYQIR